MLALYTKTRYEDVIQRRDTITNMRGVMYMKTQQQATATATATTLQKRWSANAQL